MNFEENDKLLIISNNPLSENSNNGKTIYSYIDSVPKENIAQLYFSSEIPSILGYNYFQITDKDVLKGILSPNKRGREVIGKVKMISFNQEYKKGIPKNTFTRIIREIIWRKNWKSKQLNTWLEKFKPTAIFFVGGDSIFAYNICNYISKKYNARLTLYITDDYIMPRKKENIFSKKRREIIAKKIEETLELSNEFFTVSHPMQQAYKRKFGRDSNVIVNMTDDLKKEKDIKIDDKIILVYAGSLYYGRDDVCGEIALAIKKYNRYGKKKAFFKIYTNVEPSIESKKKFEIEDVCKFCGSLKKDELIREFNKATILVFVESFDEEQIEKTKYSLSTKVPEYLSVGKPILAVGPSGIGSMEYLSDCAFNINNRNDIESGILDLLINEKLREKISVLGEEKYKLFHNKTTLQENFLRLVLGK